MKTPKPTVLFIMHMPPPVHGAAMMGQYIRESRLVNDTFDCHYINLTTAETLSDIGRFGVKKVFKYISLLRSVVVAVMRLRPSLVYITPNSCGGAFYKDFVIVMLLKRMGCKVVAHYHNKGVATRQDKRFDNFLYKRFFAGIKVILLSERLYPDVSKYVRREEVYICPNGIPQTSSPVAGAKRNNAVPRLLFLSNLLESKGVLVLLDACKELKDKGYSFICDFVGGETAEIDAARFNKEVARRGLNHIALYAGRKYGKDKDEALGKADIFVFPSCNEAFPLVNLEAMEHRLPVVTTDEGGITDVVRDGENGLICNKRDSASLASCIAKLIDDGSLRERMGDDGYKKFTAYFTVKSFEENITRIASACILGGGVINIIFFHGKMYGSDKIRMYGAADIFVLPTHYPNECFPLVLLEAMQYGLPCVSTDEGGIADIIDNGETGYVIDKCETSMLVSKLEYLISRQDVRTIMGDKGRLKYAACYTLERFESRLCGILTSLAAQ